MSKHKLIPAHDFCISHNIETAFISALQETGLIEIETIEESVFIPVSQLRQLETMVCLYYDLDINLEGIETIHHLLSQMHNMQEEITALRNRLRFYEG